MAERAAGASRGGAVRRGLLRGVAGSIVVALLLAGLALAVLHTDRGRAWLVRQVETRVAAAAGIELAIGRLEGSLLGAFRLYDVRLQAAEVAAGEQRQQREPGDWLAVRELAVRWRPWRLLRRRFEVTRVEIIEPHIDLTRLPAFGAAADVVGGARTAGGGARAGRAGVGLPLELRLGRLRVSGAVVVVAAGVTLDSLAIEVAAARAALAHPAADATFERVALSGHWVEQDLGCRDLRGTLRLVDGRPVGAVGGRLRWRALAGRLDAAAAPPPEDVSVVLELAPGRLAGVRLDRGRLHARLRGDRLELEQLEVTGTGTQLSAHGVWSGFPAPVGLSGEMHAEVADLVPWGVLLGRALAGRLVLDAALDGGSAHGEVRLAGLAAGGARIVSGAVAAHAELAGWQPARFGGTLRARIDSLPGLGALGRSRLALQLDGRRQAAGVAGHIDRLTLGGAEGAPLLALATPLEVELGGGGALELHGIDLRLARGSLRGDLARHGEALRAELALESVDLASVRRLFAASPFSAGTVDGRLALRCAAAGAAVEGAATLAVRDATLLDQGPLAARLELALEAGGARVELAARAAGRDSLALRGWVPVGLLAAAPGWRWTAGALDLTVRAAADSTVGWLGRAELAGTRIDLDGTITGPPADPSITLAARAVLPPAPGFEPLALDLAGLIGSGSAALRVTGGAGATRVDCRAELPVRVDLARPAAAVDRAGALRGAIRLSGYDLQRLRRFTGEQLELAGRLEVDAGLSGTPAAPQLAGDLRLAGGALEVVPLGIRLGDLVLDAGFSNRRIVIRSGHGRTAGGTISISGSLPVALASDDSLALALAATRLEFDLPQVERAAVDLDLQAAGTLDHPRLGGRIRVLGATIPVPDRNDRTYLELTADELAAAGADTTVIHGLAGRSGAALPLDLRLAVDIPRNVWIRNRQLEIEIGGALELSSSAGVVGLFGALHTIRGRVDLLGQRFTVDRGAVRFAGEAVPDLDVDAVYDAGQWRVHILLTGNALAPELTFTSQPPLPESDILAVLMFGRPADDLAANERAALSARASSMVSGMATAQLERALADQLGLDLIAIDAGGGGASLTVGKYLNQRTMLRVQQGLEGSPATEVTVEYALSDRLELEVMGDDQGGSALDLLFKIER